MHKRTFLLVAAALIVGMGIGLYLWNKPRPKAEDQTGIPVSAETLYAAFNADEKAANHRYLAKVLQVSGRIAEISQNQDGHQVVLLQVADPLGGVQCTLREARPGIGLNQPITLKGFCNGFTTVVIVADCVWVNP